MWQVLLAAAAAAGSGILAKKLINPSISDSSNQNLDKKIQSFQPQDPIFVSNDKNEERVSEKTSDESIFKFSSTCSGGSEMGSKNQPLRKKMVNGSKMVKKTKKKSVVMVENGGVQEGLGLEQRKISGKRLSICLKKRRTSKNAAGKCETCSSKESSVFNWGLGVGIMYMMSAGKSEISKLNSAMDETAKVVHELKSELSKRKSSLNLQSSSETGPESNTKNSKRNHFAQSDNIQAFNLSVSEEDNCTRTIVKQERQHEVMEMDQLEEELVSELQKLPWCATEGSGSEAKTDTCEDNIFTKDDNVNSYQFGGVSPSVLDKKLCHVVIEQQESQIVELESELQRTNSKLLEKETELQALKECVRKLTEFSLASVSDEETEFEAKDCRTIDSDHEAKVKYETKKSIVGMKRGMDFETYGC